MRLLIILFLLLNLTVSKAADVLPTYVRSATAIDGGGQPIGIELNPDGTKVFFARFASGASLYQYTLTTPFDISTIDTSTEVTLNLNAGSDDLDSTDVEGFTFNGDGTKVYAIDYKGNMNVHTLSTPYDFSDFTQDADDGHDWNTYLTPGDGNIRPHDIRFNSDGTKMYLHEATHTHDPVAIVEYHLATPYLPGSATKTEEFDVDPQVSAVVQDFDFDDDGTRMYVVTSSGSNGNHNLAVYKLSTGFDVTTATHVGTMSNFFNADRTEGGTPAGIHFAKDGMKLYQVTYTSNEIHEYDLSCPYGIVICEADSISNVGAQVEFAKHVIQQNTSTVFKRFEWLRRNEGKNNLNNFNTAIQFYNPLLNYWVKKFPDKLVAVNEAVEGGRSITIGREYKKGNKNSNNLDNFNTAIKSDNPLLNSWMNKLPEKITEHQASVEKKTEDKKQDLFFWSEGSIAVGRVGDTSISSTKKIGTEAITLGVDKFTDDYSIKGFAFRYGNDDVDVGSAGSNLDSNTYNITYYSTSPIKDDTKYIDKIFGIGKIRTDILTVLDGKNLTADRTGNQIYGTVKIKDEYKKDNLILIPSGQFDFGHTILNGYQEAGTGAIIVEDQHISTTKLRTAMAMVEDLSNDKYTFKRHGKLEYVADINRSSNFKYRYVSDRSTSFDDTLHTGALHNLNGEIGFDIIFPEHYSIFVIYERNHAFGSGYTDNIHIALGYLPYKDTEYAFSVDGSDNLMSQFEIKKNIKGYDFSFNLKNDLTNLGNDQEASINLNKVF